MAAYFSRLYGNGSIKLKNKKWFFSASSFRIQPCIMTWVTLKNVDFREFFVFLIYDRLLITFPWQRVDQIEE